MIRRVSRPVISLLLLWAVPYVLEAAQPLDPACHDDYTATSFETAGDDLQDFIDEYFTDAHLPFFPNRGQLLSLGLRPQGKGRYQKEHPWRTGGGHRKYPDIPGLWKAVDLGGGVWRYHLLIREAERLSETEAFNTYNDRLGEPFADYDDRAYGMILQPEDLRRRYGGHAFTINVTIYGLRDDATQLPRTVADITLTDYTAWVRQNSQCLHGGKQ